MKMIDKAKELNPDLPLHRCDSPVGCPSDLGLEKERYLCPDGAWDGRDFSCVKCWNREVEEGQKP